MGGTMKILICILMTFYVARATADCQAECQCQDEPSSCPVGVSLVTDGCNCCRVCARQAGESCNYEEKVCDHHRGLFCDHSAAGDGAVEGVCTAQSGQPCWYQQERIPSGAMFQPSCRMRCWCLQGDIGCVPQCPHEVQQPKAAACPNARLEAVPGECCSQWACDDGSGDHRQLAADEEFWSEMVENGEVALNYSDPESGLAFVPDADPLTTNVAREEDFYDEEDWSDGDELIDYQLSYIDEPSRPADSWSRTNLIPVTKVAVPQRVKADCPTSMSLWSPCSKSCGLGISMRVTNLNAECRLRRETRLCVVRPCGETKLFRPKHGRRCSKFRRAPKKVHLQYAGCQSVRRFRHKYCGLCLDQDRCCTPRNTRTANVRFECPSGARFSKNVMVVMNCRCHRNCRSANALPKSSRASYRHMTVDS